MTWVTGTLLLAVGFDIDPQAIAVVAFAIIAAIVNLIQKKAKAQEKEQQRRMPGRPGAPTPPTRAPRPEGVQGRRETGQAPISAPPRPAPPRPPAAPSPRRIPTEPARTRPTVVLPTAEQLRELARRAREALEAGPPIEKPVGPPPQPALAAKATTARPIAVPPPQASRVGPTVRTRLERMLRDRASIQAGLILGEVLSPPLALRDDN